MPGRHQVVRMVSRPSRMRPSPNSELGLVVAPTPADHINPRDLSGARGVDVDHDIADLLAGLDVPVRLDDLVQRIAPVDDRGELPGLDQVPEMPHPLLIML